MRLPGWKRAWLWVVVVCSVASIGAVGYSMTYLDGEEVFGAFGVVLFLAAAAMAWLALFPKNLAAKFDGFQRLATNFALIAFAMALFCAAGSALMSRLL